MKLLNSLIDTLQLIRWLNCLIASLGVMVGAYLTHRPWLTADSLLTACAVFLVCAGGNCLNDVMDVAGDSISHPNRALVSGKLSPRFATTLATALFVIGLAMASVVNPSVLVIGAVGVLMIVIYDLWLKKVLLLGNFLVAFSAGLTFLIGGAAIGSEEIIKLPGPLIPAILAVFFHMVREIVKDAADLEGDRRVGSSSLPGRIGVSASLFVASGLTITLIVLTVIPYIMSWFSLLYAVVAVGLAELPPLVLLIRLAIRPDVGLNRMTSNALKFGMVLGLVALVVG